MLPPRNLGRADFMPESDTDKEEHRRILGNTFAKARDEQLPCKDAIKTATKIFIEFFLGGS
jgi:hypothetical protein